MKKIRIFALALAVLTVTAMCAVTVCADDGSVVYVTIANGDLVLAHAAVTVNDADGDGVLTIDEALASAHDAAYEGGADEGYASESTDYGLSMTKLWGIENGGAYGYYVNNASATSLSDKISAGDHIVAYVYTDTAAWSDTYSFFDVTATHTAIVTLTLSAAGYDENWAPVTTPVAGATITVDGARTEFVTDGDGHVTVTVGEGTHIISAESDSVTLVPPVCIATVAEGENEAPQTGYETFALAAVSLGALCVIVKSRRYAER